MPFVKGQSGNPSGRPKVAFEVRDLAREASPKAIRRQIELMDSEDERVALAATEAVLNRGYGKPISQVEVGKPGEFEELSLEQKRERAVGLARQLGIGGISPSSGAVGNGAAPARGTTLQ